MPGPFVTLGSYSEDAPIIGTSLSIAGYRSRTNYKRSSRDHLPESVIVGWSTGPINIIQRRTYELLAERGLCTLVNDQKPVRKAVSTIGRITWLHSDSSS